MKNGWVWVYHRKLFSGVPDNFPFISFVWIVVFLFFVPSFLDPLSFICSLFLFLFLLVPFYLFYLYHDGYVWMGFFFLFFGMWMILSVCYVFMVYNFVIIVGSGWKPVAREGWVAVDGVIIVLAELS